MIRYYGSKAHIAQHYPKPTHDLIVEPFAGGAAYAWRHHERQVYLNEYDPRTFSVWEFLLRRDALDLIERLVPETVVAGQRISELLPSDTPLGLLELCRMEAHPGCGGRRGLNDVITPFGAVNWNGGHEVYARVVRDTPPARFHRRMRYVIPRIAHWRVTCLPYHFIGENPEATWFIDPPYNNKAGKVYAASVVGYDGLASWCRERRGQVIVCENVGASWLPFKELRPGRRGWNVATRKTNVAEAVWTNED